MEPPGLGVVVAEMGLVGLIVAVGDGVGHSTWGRPTSTWALVVVKVRVKTWPWSTGKMAIRGGTIPCPVTATCQVGLMGSLVTILMVEARVWDTSGRKVTVTA